MYETNTINYNHILDKINYNYFTWTVIVLFRVLKHKIILMTYKISNIHLCSVNVDENHELFCSKNKKVVGKFKIETPRIIWIDEFNCLGSKTYSFKCNENNLKGISKFQSKHNNL